MDQNGWPETASEAKHTGWKFIKILPDRNVNVHELQESLRGEGREIAHRRFTQNGRPTAPKQYALWARHESARGVTHPAHI